MLMKEYCFIDDYIISNYICFMFLKAISEAIWMKMYPYLDTFECICICPRSGAECQQNRAANPAMPLQPYEVSSYLHQVTCSSLMDFLIF